MFAAALLIACSQAVATNSAISEAGELLAEDGHTREEVHDRHGEHNDQKQHPSGRITKGEVLALFL